jgi:hypothetical protein
LKAEYDLIFGIKKASSADIMGASSYIFNSVQQFSSNRLANPTGENRCAICPRRHYRYFGAGDGA